MSEKVVVSQKYEKEILKELEAIPYTKLSAVLRLVRLLKDEFLPVSQKVEKEANALLDVDKFAINMGIPDLAKNHDHYLYGVEKNE